MRTLPVAATNVKAFYAFLDDVYGVLTKVQGTMYFMADSGEITEIEPQHCPFLMPLGEVSLSETARTLDALHGGAARIATTRQMEVA
jgi:hypothetical protein